ncbi:unnamed protein product [Closterium sp. Naga37s-1]|nr:unnamed protein product [Closterium sp. Naga37s-1]
MRSPAAVEADPADESAPPPLRLTSSPVSSASPACSAFPASPKLLVLPDSAFFPSPRIPEARFTSPRTSAPPPFEPPQNTAPRPAAFRFVASPRACGTALEAPQKCGTAPTTPSCPPLVEPRLPRARTCDVAADSGGRAPAVSAGASAIRGTLSASGYSPAVVSPASACATTGAVDQVNGHVSTFDWAEASDVDTLDIPPWVRERLSLSRAEKAQNNESAAHTRVSRIDRETMADGNKRAGRVECGGECGKECGGECAENRNCERDAEGEKPSLWDIMQWESDMISSVCSTAAAKSPRPPFSKSSTFEAPQKSLSKRHRSASALPTTPPPTPSASKASLTVQICDDASANGGDLSFFEELLLEFGAGEGEEAGGEMEDEPGWAEKNRIPAEETAHFEKVAPVVPQLDDSWGDYSVKMLASLLLHSPCLLPHTMPRSLCRITFNHQYLPLSHHSSLPPLPSRLPSPSPITPPFPLSHHSSLPPLPSRLPCPSPITPPFPLSHHSSLAPLPSRLPSPSPITPPLPLSRHSSLAPLPSLLPCPSSPDQPHTTPHPCPECSYGTLLCLPWHNHSFIPLQGKGFNVA